MLHRIRVASVALLGLACASPQASAQTKVGPAFEISKVTKYTQYYPSVTVLKSGDALIAWTSIFRSGADIVGRRYRPAAAQLGKYEILINGNRANAQNEPAVAALSGGGFVVVWTTAGAQPIDSNIHGQLFSAVGRIGNEFQINTYTPFFQDQAKVVGLNDGGFVVVWASLSTLNASDPGYDVHGQRYNAAGEPVGGEFQINTFTHGPQGRSSIAALRNGGFVVVWDSNGQDRSGFGVYGQRYSAAGVRIGKEFRINTQTLGDQYFPSVASLSNGDFVVTWTDWSQSSAKPHVFGQHYSAAGLRVGSEFQINNSTPSQYGGSIAALKDGGFVSIWATGGAFGSLADIYGQRYSAAGANVGEAFLVGTGADISSSQPEVVGLHDGGFLVVWTFTQSAQSLLTIYGQQFAP